MKVFARTALMRDSVNVPVTILVLRLFCPLLILSRLITNAIGMQDLFEPVEGTAA